MIVYADVLICLNTVVNYLILSITEKFCKTKTKNFRLILGAFVGALFSLYIFLPQSTFLVESLVRISVSALIVIVTFGCKKIKPFLKQVIVFYCVTFAYGGLMIALWYIVEPYGMVVNNGIVYFNISPIILIALTVIAYILMTLFSKIFKTYAKTELCKIEIIYDNKKIILNALVDSGNFLKDTVTDSEVVIVQKNIGEYLFGRADIFDFKYTKNNYDAMKNFRVIPYKTVLGEGIMPAFKCDEVLVSNNKNIIKKTKVIVGVINYNFSDDYSAIISPTFISE